MRTPTRCAALVLCGFVITAGSTMAQQPAESAPVSPLQSALNDSAAAGRFTFVVFYRDNSAATQQMYQVAKDGVAARTANTTLTTAKVDDPAEASLVERFGVSRAPMPMTVVVAPNGAVTGLFAKALTDEQLSTAVVPPTMMRCMKELQDKKLVFVCLGNTDKIEVPSGVRLLQQNPLFKDRMTLVGMPTNDEQESRFYKQMNLKANSVTGPYAVLIAPPGVLVGHFTAASTADEIATAIHKAGQCCEDPNCKHAQPQTSSASAPTRR